MKNIVFAMLWFSSLLATSQTNNFSTTGDVSVYGSNSLEFGQSQPKEPNAGKIAYQRFSDGLDIVGAGTTNLNRKIKFHAEGGSFFTGVVGIGTSSPYAKLHIFEQSQNVVARIETGGAMTSSIIYKNNYEEWQVGNQAYGTSGFNFASLSGIKMTIKSSGNVGIGTTNPDAMLTVKGTIHSNEVKVDLNVPGPDYVFEPTYKLMSLEETKAYIEKYKHLPEVPSAKEMETNGVQLGEMNMLLLKKVEELTLYLIELKKENDALKSRVERIETNK